MSLVFVLERAEPREFGLAGDVKVETRNLSTFQVQNPEFPQRSNKHPLSGPARRQTWNDENLCAATRRVHPIIDSS